MIGVAIILTIAVAGLTVLAAWLHLRGRMLAQSDWPQFVCRSAPLDDAVPVVMYHDVTQAQFTGDIEYLRAEGYRLLRLEEFGRFLRDGVKPAKRCALLTFDDGLLSTYQIAEPILRKCGGSGVCFVAPGLIREGPARPTLDDVWTGGTLAADISNRRNELTFWSELTKMHQGGAIEIQSHTWDHRLIYTSSEVIAFFDGNNRTWQYGLSVPVPSELSEADYSWWQPRAALGRPLYRYRSRMSSAPRFVESPSVRHACEEFVANNGGPLFFQQDHWRKPLREVYDAAVAAAGAAGRFETTQEQETAICQSLVRSKMTLQERLGVNNVEYVCFPYNEASTLACALARRAGYAGVFAGRSGTPQNFVCPGDDPLRIHRITSNIRTISFVPSLPGRNRQSLNRIIVRSLMNRFARRT